MFGEDSKKYLAFCDVKTVKLPFKGPNLNAPMERFNRSIKEECLNHYMIISESQLCHLVKTYCDFCNTERFHQGIGNGLLVKGESSNDGPVKCNDRLGGLLRFYHRAA